MQQNTKTGQISSLGRKLAAKAALGSVRAEGLEPSSYARTRLDQYARGEISLSQLRLDTLNEIKTQG